MHPEDPGAGSQSFHATAWSSRHPPAFPSRGDVSREAAATLPYLVLLLCAASTGSLRSARLHWLGQGWSWWRAPNTHFLVPAPSSLLLILKAAPSLSIFLTYSSLPLPYLSSSLPPPLLFPPSLPLLLSLLPPPPSLFPSLSPPTPAFILWTLSPCLCSFYRVTYQSSPLPHTPDGFLLPLPWAPPWPETLPTCVHTDGVRGDA